MDRGLGRTRWGTEKLLVSKGNEPRSHGLPIPNLAPILTRKQLKYVITMDGDRNSNERLTFAWAFSVTCRLAASSVHCFHCEHISQLINNCIASVAYSRCQYIRMDFKCYLQLCPRCVLIPSNLYCSLFGFLGQIQINAVAGWNWTSI
jgi:hypothetical protein